MIPRKVKQIFIIVLALVIPMKGVGQVSFSQNHPELNWKIVETDHFKIVYHQGIETLANEVATVAEEVYTPITSDLGMEPPHKTSIIVTDYLDYSNGLSTPLGHYILIWAESETKYMTGEMKWLRAVVAHEFTHLVSFWAVRAFPGFWRELLALGFVPTWFLEGIAEYEAEKWCTHREMLLRVVAYHQKLLPYKKLTGFIGTDEIGSRLVYEQGHSLIRYIANQFGHDKIRVILQKYRSLPISFNLALKRSIGLSESRLFSTWKREVDSHYTEAYQEHHSVTQIGKILKTPLQGNYGARWSPDGEKVAIVGIKDYDDGVTELYIMDTVSGTIQKVAGPYVNGFFSWSPDGKFIVFSQKHIIRTGSEINDLFLFDTATLRIKKLTDHERATDPSFSPDGQKIVYVVHRGTHSNLVILDIRTGARRAITDFFDWTEVFTPHWSPDGKQIVFSIWDDQGSRDICLINADGTGFNQLTDQPEDERYPVWSPGGDQIAFISYRNGIPNLYLMEMADGTTHPITDTPGGVFNPTWLPDGKHLSVIAFENRDTTQIVVVPLEKNLRQDILSSKIDWLSFHKSPEQVPETAASPLSLTSMGVNSKPYHSFAHFQSQLLLPYYGNDEKGWQPGLIHLAADPLRKHTLITALSYRSRLHVFFDYVNRQFNPTIGLNMNRTTIDHGNFLKVVYQDGSSRILPLYENFWSSSLALYWNINFGRSLLSTHLLWLNATTTYRNIINVRDYKQINTENWIFPLLQGWINYVTFGYTWQKHRPDIGYDIHPKSGWSFSIFARHADSWMGSDLKFSQLGLTGVVRRELPIHEHVFAFQAGVSFRDGKQPVQSRLAIGDQTIRGSSRSQEGDQQCFINLEYRFSLIRDSGLKLWLLYFERFCGALFLDLGTAWGNELMSVDQIHYRNFASTSWLHTTGLEIRHRLYLLGKIPIVLSGGYAIESTLIDKSHFYYRIGAVF